MMYLIRHPLKGVLPIRSLVIAGYGHANFNPPRGEYNNLNSFLQLFGGMDALVKEISRFSWSQWVLTDFCAEHDFEQALAVLSGVQGFTVVVSKSEAAYRIGATNFESYKKQLSSSIRAKYFNRRTKLVEQGKLELNELTSSADCFGILNQFHQLRWGRPCYSPQSMDFFSLFVDRIRSEGGTPVMQLMQVDGEIVSVLFDIVWQGVRYNLQSGYAEGRYGQLALGSLHLGFAIQHALENGQGYDLLAGMGKHSNYKEKIATESTSLKTYCLAQGWLKGLYKIYGKN
ncbi:MAG: hypothetical protein B0W54_13490 [Cellvibrio sp. 79]|nr:MAG: hypothetical protein B0W54_13490 [Cellvibrio sp. 79]